MLSNFVLFSEQMRQKFLIIYDLSETFFNKGKKIAMEKTCWCESEKKWRRTTDSSRYVCIVIFARRLYLTLKLRRFITEMINNKDIMGKIPLLNQLCVNYHAVVTQVFRIKTNNWMNIFFVTDQSNKRRSEKLHEDRRDFYQSLLTVQLNVTSVQSLLETL